MKIEVGLIFFTINHCRVSKVILANQRRQNRRSLQTISGLLQVVYVPSFVCQKPKWEQKQGGCTVGQVIYSSGTAGVRARKVEHLKLKPSMHMRNLNGNI
jgi:hypothetical protein